MGGKIIKDNKTVATHWVFYSPKPKIPVYSHPGIVKVHFTFITECFFALADLPPEKWLITKA
jgi:hypothetical protein